MLPEYKSMKDQGESSQWGSGSSAKSIFLNSVSGVWGVASLLGFLLNASATAEGLLTLKFGVNGAVMLKPDAFPKKEAGEQRWRGLTSGWWYLAGC